MKTIKISKFIYEYNLDKANWYDENCDCFGFNIENRFYLYSEGYEGKYWLDVFDTTLENLLCDSNIVSKLAMEIIEKDSNNICNFCNFISDCMNGNFNYNKMPFELKDIIYAYNR